MQTRHSAAITGDGDIDCENEILAEFRSLVERALKAGWAEEEVANALLSLSRNYAESLLDLAIIDAQDSHTLQ